MTLPFIYTSSQAYYLSLAQHMTIFFVLHPFVSDLSQRIIDLAVVIKEVCRLAWILVDGIGGSAVSDISMLI